MKQLSLIFVGLIAAAGMAQATVTLDLDAGVLSTHNTSTTNTPNSQPLTSGLLQLIAYDSATGNFTPPTATSFVGGDTANEQVIATFSFQQGGSGYVTGETANNSIMFSYAGSFQAGDELLLRWYPTLTTAATAPGAGTTYGQYRSNSGENGGIAWFGPADGTYTVPNGLNFLTTSAGGSNSDTVGEAQYTVSGVPEPSSMILFGCAALGILGVPYLRRQRSKWSCQT